MKLLILSFFILTSLYSGVLPKEYYEIKDVKKKKDYFFNFLYPSIKKENLSIIEERNFILSLKMNQNLKTNEYNKLHVLANKYLVKDVYNYKKLLKRVDIIHDSLALSQAAVESGWGKSRFVKLGNNLFGHWTYGKKGIIPLKRNKGAKHKIRIFSSFDESIKAYMFNLNTNRAYKSFRKKRSLLRLKNKQVDGLTLSQTLINYSQIREKYLTILKSMILFNKLKKYDDKFNKESNK